MQMPKEAKQMPVSKDLCDWIPGTKVKEYKELIRHLLMFR
jgi:hypothetical protein